jgi:N6-L-threonylcarbamoyladenine synthase
MHKPIVILGIETSCDETAVSVVRHTPEGTAVLSNVVSSQVSLHAQWGGVVPDLAAREHAKNMVPVLEAGLRDSGLMPEAIDAIAVTQGPGLIPALLIGNVAAKTLAYAWKKPLLGIHHIEGHIYANFIGESPKNQNTKDRTRDSQFPLLALVVSGGHTQLVLMGGHFQYEILGETQDDAAGEAFDKVAKMLGLPYPGGPVVAKRADAFQKRQAESICHSGPDPESPGIPKQVRDDNRIEFPRPMINSGDFNFSFSGLKTAVLYALRKQPDRLEDELFKDEICYQFQEAVIDVLVTKTRRAIERFRPKTFVIAGGVSANTELRARLQTMIEEHFPQTTFLTPEFAYSLDNAAMIAAAGAFRWETMDEKQKWAAQENWKTLRPDANLKLG